MSFAQNVANPSARVIKFTRDSNLSKWKDAPLIVNVDLPHQRQDVTQNCFVVDNEKVLVVGNYLTLLDLVTLN